MTPEPDQLHVIRCYDRLPPLPGGMERHIAELTAAQRRQGVRVTEVYNQGQPRGDAVRLWPNLRTDFIRPNLLRWLIFYLGASFQRIDLSDGRLPIMHVHGDWQAFLLGRFAARALGIGALAATLHEWARASDCCYSLALRGYDPIFSTGASEAKRLSRISGKEVVHLPSAPADHFFGKRTTTTRAVDVIAVGTINARKNYEMLVQCASLLPRFSFVIYGDGPERPRLEALVARKGLRNVHFAGPASTEEVANAMCAARLFVNTALAEGTPTTALEAMACGLPVVLTPSNDYSQIVTDGVNGRVMQSYDIAELARSIEVFLDNADQLKRGGEESSRIAALHRWDAKAKKVTEAMANVLRRRNAQ